MAITTRQTSQYVVFVKASTTLWNSLPDTQKKDNILYFVADSDDDNGKLYLGKKLISNGTDKVSLSINDLEDVDFKTAAVNGDILIYNADREKWENVSLDSRIGNIIKVFTGATAESDGKVGLVPVPTKSDTNNYLRGDGTWANPTESLSGDLEAVKSDLNVLKGNESPLKSVREIANEEATSALTKVVNNAPEAFDTLGEIAAWIQSHPSTETVIKMNNQLTAVEKTVYGNPVVDDKGNPVLDSNGNQTYDGTGLTKITSTLQSDVNELKEYEATAKTNFQTITNNMADFNTQLSNLTTDVNNKYNELDNRMKWQELAEEETS